MKSVMAHHPGKGIHSNYHYLGPNMELWALVAHTGKGFCLQYHIGIIQRVFWDELAMRPDELMSLF